MYHVSQPPYNNQNSANHWYAIYMLGNGVDLSNINIENIINSKPIKLNKLLVLAELKPGLFRK